MESCFKLKLARMFHKASMGTCSSREITYVVEKDVLLPQNHPDSVSLHSSPAIFRPKLSDDSKHQPISRSNADVTLPRRKIFQRQSPFLNTITTSDSLFYEKQSCRKMRKKTKKKKKKKKKRDMSSCLGSNNDCYYNGWWGSSEEDEDNSKQDETDTMFSSNNTTHTSDSSAARRRRKNGSSRRRRTGGSYTEMGLKDSFAVVKKSSDPYNDFRVSMVEMIVEKQIFSGEDLEQLLLCFLKLNASRHHRVIVEVFTEIWEALFSNLRFGSTLFFLCNFLSSS